MDSKLIKNLSVQFQQKELDACMLSVQEATTRFRAHFCQQFINRMMSLQTGSIVMKETDNRVEARMFSNAMLSIAFQVLFIELRKMNFLKMSMKCIG
ncbi:hypothetical protein SLEP1_g14303 [Rubroshorea leprosula]|uniref:Uncharacterized protein n=1 Tax=Rubroshorea leprosula TaxID=152421 RepID=A0AAV5IPF1_9ROSI|nr:hypothetical protein SLEP1_g14303 [Rubroshorea leprosula]